MILKTISNLDFLNNNKKEPTSIYNRLFLSIFLETDAIQYEIITPELAKYYILYYNSSYSIDALLDKYQTILKTFIKYIILRNTLEVINIDYNYLLQNNNLYKNLKNSIDPVKLEYYIYSQRMNTLDKPIYNVTKSDLSVSEKNNITNELMSKILSLQYNCDSKSEIDLNSIFNKKDKFNYLLLLLKTYIIMNNEYILKNNIMDKLNTKKQEILTKIGNIGYLLGYNNLGNLLLAYDMI